MKKRILVLALLISALSFGQKKQSIITTTSTEVVLEKFKPYVSAGISFSNCDDFSDGTYVSVEGGVTKGNLSLGLNVGSRNLNFEDHTIKDYYYEPKVYASYPIGNLTGTLLFGWGKYVDTPKSFIEYGGGIAYPIGNISYGVGYSNFDGVDFISPSVSYTFN